VRGHLPYFVVEEMRRQKFVRNFTLAVLLVLSVPFGVSLLAAPSPSRGRPPGVTSANLATPWAQSTYPWYRPSYTPFPALTDVPRVLMPSLGGTDEIVVETGDTLSTLACRYGTTVEYLQTLNEMGTRTDLDAGQKLTVPGGLRLDPIRPACR
jgi:hypothetical protein